ncbi:MAG: BlaI/MecI/CopY family transcriptional regulator [Zavarzinella sp.]
MARSPKDVTNSELAVLQVLWNRAPATLRQIVDELATDSQPMQASTVLKLLERLEAKGWVVRDKSSSVQFFSPTAEKDQLIGQRLQGIAEQLCEGSVAPLLSQLVKGQQLTETDRKMLRDLIQELDGHQPGETP